LPFEITVGPPQLVIHQGHTILVADKAGQIPFGASEGLYFFDTRVISAWQIYANGEQWQLLNSGSVGYYAARVFLTNNRIKTEQGEIPPKTMGLTLSRSIGGGVHEDIDVVNYGPPLRFNLEIAIRSDFADLLEVKSGNIVRRGRITTEWSDQRMCLRTVYRNQDFCREVTVVTLRSDSPPLYANGRISFEVNLRKGDNWHACVGYELGNGRARLAAPPECIADAGHSKVGRRIDNWKKAVLKIETDNAEFYGFFRRSIEDLAGLRLPIERTDQLQFVPAAGVPWFVTLFGRDSLVASLQNAIVYPEFAMTALDALGALQAQDVDDYRDAEPGKIPHELRHGELAHFQMIPNTPYYGTADATILYLIVLHATWRCSGNEGLLQRHLQTAERCLDWIDNHGDRDGDGFQEYATRSPAGYENHGWKDAGDAVVNPDGSLVKAPKALCELQGYVYDAWMRMAEVFVALGKADRAAALRTKAELLFRRFNEAFWDEESGFYAYALDCNKRKVLTVASNPGHCLWSGIVRADRAGRVVKRLMAPDMWSGWGIRTLSAENGAYNPYSYQNGSIWPHDNGIIALGLRRYGFAQEAAHVARDVTSAVKYFAEHRVPELYAGLQREPTSFPVQYLGANVPQAWAAGSAFAFLQAMLGLQPDAPSDRLHVDPALPDWLPDLTLRDMRIGKRQFDLHFWRDGAQTRWQVLRGEADRISHRSFATATQL
jgi:glycogen debranching enzyme